MSPLASCFLYPLIALTFLGISGSIQASDGKTLAEAERESIPATEKTLGNHRTQGGDCELNEIKQELLERVNAARGQARQCGDEKFEATEPLSWNCQLEAAAEAHSRDMAENDFFSHTGPEGDGIGERVKASGYDWMAVGENIAAGQPSVVGLVDDWLSSPGHCTNIMNEKFTETGMAKVDDPNSKYSPFWTQVLARPQ